MNIKKTEVWVFEIPFQQGTVALSVPEESQEKAVKVLKEWFSKSQVELSMAFPETAPSAPTDPIPAPSEFNKMQIMLLEDLAKSCGIVENETIAVFVERITGFPLNVENFKDIVSSLEAIRDGAPPKNAKKKG